MELGEKHQEPPCQKQKNQHSVNAVTVIFTVFMISARLISGIHRLTDIIVGMLLSAALVMFYYSAIKS